MKWEFRKREERMIENKKYHPSHFSFPKKKTNENQIRTMSPIPGIPKWN